MKKLLSILLLFVCHLAQSQTVPQGINYQAVALDQRGQPIPGIDIVGRPIDDAEIGVRIAILENTPTGNILYQEEHEVLTDLYGMFNLVIGQGLQVSVDPFSSINWQGDKFLQVELSIENDGEFVLSAVQQLMSVPYAFLAENAMVAQTAVDVDDADADPSNEIQTLSKSGSIISLTNGGNVTVFDGNYNNLSNTPVIPSKTSDLTNDSGFLTTEVDGSTTNELQVLSLSNDTIYLTSGGYVVLPAGFDGDYSSLTNTPSIPSKTSDLTNDSGFITAEVDGSTSNELQLLSISNDTIYLSDGGFVKLPAGFDGAYSSLTGVPSLPTKTSDLTNDSGFITGEVDGSTTNELQLLSMSNDTLYLTDGGFVVLPGGFDGDYNNLTNAPAIPIKTSDLTNDSGFISTEKDSSTTNELQTLSISNDTIFLSDGGFIKLSEMSSGELSSTIDEYNNLVPNSSVHSGNSNSDGSGNIEILKSGFYKVSYFIKGQSNWNNGNPVSRLEHYSNNSWVALTSDFYAATAPGTAYGAYARGFDDVFVQLQVGDRIRVFYNGSYISSTRIRLERLGNSNTSSDDIYSLIDTIEPINPTSGQFWYDYDNGQLKSYLKTPSSSKYLRLGQNVSQSSMGTNVSSNWTIYRLTTTEDIYSWGALEGNYTSSLSSSCSGEIKVYLDQDTLFTNGFGNEYFSRSSTPVLGGQTMSDIQTFSGLIEKNTIIWIIVKHHSCGSQYAIQSFSQSIPTEFKDVGVYYSLYDPLIYFATNGFISPASRFPRVSFYYKNISLKWNVIKNFNETF